MGLLKRTCQEILFVKEEDSTNLEATKHSCEHIDERDIIYIL